MEKTNIVLEEEKKEVLKLEINTDPQVLLKDEVGDHLFYYWADAVISSMPFQWFRIKKDGNRIIIEPVKIEAIE